jgi:hypothetical protein
MVSKLDGEVGLGEFSHKSSGTALNDSSVRVLWQFVRQNWLSKEVFQSYDAILDHCCYAWNKLVGQPWHLILMSIGMQDWIHRF